MLQSFIISFIEVELLKHKLENEISTELAAEKKSVAYSVWLQFVSAQIMSLIIRQITLFIFISFIIFFSKIALHINYSYGS